MYTETQQNKLRSYLRGLAKKRSNGVVTADDVHRFVTNNKLRLNEADQISLTRSVLNESEFYRVGFAPSSRPEARGRKVAEWSLA